MNKLKNKDANQIIYQSNAVVQAKRKMTIDEARMFYVALSKLNPRLPKSEFYDSATRTIKIPVSELVKMYGNCAYYSKIRDIKNSLKGMGIEVYTSDKKWKDTQIFEEFDFDAEERGTLNISFTQKIAPYLLELTDGGYTKLFLQDAFKVNSHYALRILELMLQYRNWHIARHGNKIIRTISIKDLRAYYGLEDGKYATVGVFKKNCVKVPVEIINKKTSYNVEVEDIKERNRIIAFKFILYLPDDIDRILKENELSSNTIENDIQEVNELIQPEFGQAKLLTENDTLTDLINLGVSEHIAKDLISNNGEEYCKEKIVYAKSIEGIKNIAGWVVDAIRNNYQAPQNTDYTSENNKKILASKFFQKIGYDEVIANMLASATAENVFSSTDVQYLEEKGLQSHEVRECYLKGDFEPLLDELFGKEEEVIALQNKVLEAFRGRTRLTLDDIKKANELGADLPKLAASLGVTLKELL